MWSRDSFLIHPLCGLPIVSVPFAEQSHLFPQWPIMAPLVSIKFPCGHGSVSRLFSSHWYNITLLITKHYKESDIWLDNPHPPLAPLPPPLAKVLGILGSLPLHIHFKISLSVSNDTPCWHFDWKYIKSTAQFRGSCQLYDKSFPIHEYGMQVH